MEGDLKSLTIRHVDVPLLMSQEDYFAYADKILAWTNYEGRFRDGKLENNPVPKPPPVRPPALDLP
jgi:hypothetical protein